MRIIVYTGKGGVGKTSIAAATALRCADLGQRALVLSTDAAHSLGDSLRAELGPEPREVAPNLHAQEIDVQYSLQKYWGVFQQFLIGLFTQRGVQNVIAEEVTILPGLEEGASLLWLEDYAKSGQYDVVVIDAAPTAETLRLLSLPDVARWWVERIVPIGRAAAFLAPLARPFGIQAPDAEAIAAVEGLFASLDAARSLLADAERSSMRLVVNAERMVVKETQRTYTYLNLYGYPVDAVICNRLIPQSVSDPYFDAWKDLQKANLALIHEAFEPLPILKGSLYPTEMGGLDLLRQMGDELFSGRSPAEHFYRGQPQKLENLPSGGYVLRLALPFTAKENVELFRDPEELTLIVGAYRRNIALPRLLWGLEVASAKMEDGGLAVTFQ